MQTTLFGSTQNTLLAGGRYDYLASQFGHKGILPAVGWAAGINRLVLILEFMQQQKAIGVQNNSHVRAENVIGIVSCLDKSEIEEFQGPISELCITLQRELQHIQSDI